jgi:hypothetical protein
MKPSLYNHLFKFRKRETVRGKAEPVQHFAQEAEIISTSPSGWGVFFAYFLALVFLWASDMFFTWFTPYFQEVFKNLRGLPLSWADLGIYWAERGLGTLAVLMAVYHNIWKVTTRYRVGAQNLSVESWLPMRKVTIISYGAIRKAGYRQGVLGFLVNYADIEIDTGSPLGPVVLPNCRKPKVLLKALQEKVDLAFQPHFLPAK